LRRFSRRSPATLRPSATASQRSARPSVWASWSARPSRRRLASPRSPAARRRRCSSVSRSSRSSPASARRRPSASERPAPDPPPPHSEGDRMLDALVTVAAEEGADQNPLFPATYDIIWSAVCFVIIAIGVVGGALPRINKVLDARSAAIEGNIEKADEAQRQAEAALAEYTQQLADARREAGEIREGARADGKKIIDEAKANATIEAERITAS